jgi:hypothetical protein
LSQWVDCQLPERALEPVGAEDIALVAARREPGQRIESGHARSPVDEQLRLSFGHGQHDLLAFLIGRELCNLNAQGPDSPDVALATEADRTVGRLDQTLEGRLQTRDRFGLSLLRNRPNRPDVDALVAENAALDRGDDIPLAGPGETRDAGLDPPERPRIGERVLGQPSWGSISP